MSFCCSSDLRSRSRNSRSRRRVSMCASIAERTVEFDADALVPMRAQQDAEPGEYIPQLYSALRSSTITNRHENRFELTDPERLTPRDLRAYAALARCGLAGRARARSPATSHVEPDRRIALAPARPATAPGVRRSLALRAPFGEPRSMVAHRRLSMRGGHSVAPSRGNVEGTKRERNPSEQGLRWPALTHRCGPRRSQAGCDHRWALGDPDSDGEGGFEPPMHGNAHTGSRDRCGRARPKRADH
jgi:hypothetical protein